MSRGFSKSAHSAERDIYPRCTLHKICYQRTVTQMLQIDTKQMTEAAGRLLVCFCHWYVYSDNTNPQLFSVQVETDSKHIIRIRFYSTKEIVLLTAPERTERHRWHARRRLQCNCHTLLPRGWYVPAPTQHNEVDDEETGSSEHLLKMLMTVPCTYALM